MGRFKSPFFFRFSIGKSPRIATGELTDGTGDIPHLCHVHACVIICIIHTYVTYVYTAYIYTHMYIGHYISLWYTVYPMYIMFHSHMDIQAFGGLHHVIVALLQLLCSLKPRTAKLNEEKKERGPGVNK